MRQRRPRSAAGHHLSLRSQANAPVLNNAKLGVIMMLGAEAMFFAGLIGAFIVFRLAAEQWPPPFQPRLPVGVTGVNTLILLISAVTMHFSIRAIRVGDIGRSRQFLTVTAFLGTLFLAIQGFEWIKHAAGRRPEQLGVVVGPDLLDPLRRVQRRRLHVVGEAALDVVVLAVDVGGERAAHRDEARARRHRHEPAARAAACASARRG